MKKNLVIAVMFFTGFVFAAQSYGACKRTMNGNVIINYSYKEKGKEYYRKNMVYIDFISAQGIYRHKGPLSTRCNPVSIKKAKNRAKDEVHKIFKNKYEGKADIQKNALCRKIPPKIKKIAEYLQIDNLEVIVHHKNTLGTKVFRIPAASKAKFLCN
ncbi:MAG: hypothetical protein D3926_18485 [Desulfobacteraceae bacterium]|nr:MAG: hypothetical protein D3926_18485 [Desulfobacteraceae bacterium]